MDLDHERCGGRPVIRLASPCERLDDEQAAAAAWAWTRERRQFGCVSRFGIVRDRVRLRNVQQRARFGDVVSAVAVGQEPVVADAMEAFGKTCIRKRRMNSSVASVMSLYRPGPWIL